VAIRNQLEADCIQVKQRRAEGIREEDCCSKSEFSTNKHVERRCEYLYHCTKHCV